MQSIGISGDNLVAINKIFFNFLWNNKKDNGKKVIERVRRDIICSKLAEGGLNMIDIVKMQDSFLLKWADKLFENEDESNDGNYSWKTIPIMQYTPVGNLNVFNCSVNSSQFRGLDLIKSLFWKRVLKVWLDYKYSKEERLSFNVNNPIFNNSSIKFKKKTIFY